MAKTYAQVVGVVLIIVGLVGFIIPSLYSALTGGAPATVVHNLIHLISGVIGAYVGFRAVTGARTFAQVFGVIYTLVAILGFVSAATLEALGVPVSVVLNVIHLVIGLWGLWAGFSRQAAVA